jgi:UDP-glucuronate 4-epimerase
MTRILVTGGAGFIGSHVCEALLWRGDEVIALDNFDDFYPAEVKRRNIAAAAASPRFQLIEGDIRDPEAVQEAIGAGMDAVIHLAAKAGVRPSIEQPLLYQDVNVRGTLVLLEACRENPKCRFIFGSSSSVYGNNPKVPFSEADRVDDPISPYAATKKAGELLCHTYHHLYGLPVTCLRFFTVYGPRQRPDLAIHKFARCIEAGRPIPVFGDGSMMRDFTYVDDIVVGVLRALDRCAAFRIYNLGGSQPVSVNELIRRLEEAMDKKAIIERLPLQPGDVERTYADLTLSRRELGFNPTTELRTGLKRFVHWLRHGEAVASAI